MKEIVERFQSAFESDDLDWERKGVQLKEFYEDICEPEHRFVVDQVFIRLCGYSLETLIKKSSSLTELETKVLDYVNDNMKEYGDGYSDVTVEDLSNYLGNSLNTIKGVVGSLTKKGLVITDHVEESRLNIVYSTVWND